MTLKSKKLRDSARGQMCQVRVPCVCNGNTETTILAHLNGGGMGMKNSDIHGAFACSDCHFWLDVGYAKNSTRSIRDAMHAEAVIRTQKIWLKMGLIDVK